MFLRTLNVRFHLLKCNLSLPNLNGQDKLSSIASHVNVVTSGLLDGTPGLASNITSGPLSVEWDGVPITSESLIGEIRQNALSEDTVAVRGKKRLNIGVDILDDGYFVKTIMGSILMTSLAIKMIDRYATAEGVGMNSQMNARRTSALNKLNDLLDVPICMANAGEMMIYTDPTGLEISMATDDPLSITGVSRLDARSSALDNILSSNLSKVETDIVSTTPLTISDVPTELRKFGLYGWYTESGTAVRMLKNSPALLQLDDITKNWLDVDGSELMGLLPLYMKTFFSGPNELVAPAASKTFVRDLKKLGIYPGKSEWSTVGEADYLSSVGIPNALAVTQALQAERMVSRGMVEVEVTARVDDDKVSLYTPWVNRPFYEWPEALKATTLLKSGNTLYNEFVTLTFTHINGETIENAFYEGYRGNGVAPEIIKSAKLHLSTIMAILYTVSFADDARTWLRNPTIAVKDMASVYKRMGLEFAQAREAIIGSTM